MKTQRNLVGVIDKLCEARFFLHKVAAATDFLECFYHVSAFGSACYSIVECLQRTAKDPAEALGWWQKSYDTLRESPMHKYFHDGRNQDIHEGFGLVSGLHVDLVESGGELVSHENWLLGETREYSPGEPARECRDYFESILRVCLEGYRLFARVWDPDSMVAHSLAELERAELRPAH